MHKRVRAHCGLCAMAATTLAISACPSWMLWLGWSSLVRKSGSMIEKAGSVPFLQSLKNSSIFTHGFRAKSLLG